jgi:hypothetical protein
MTPASDAARRAGCRCSVTSNHHGKGTEHPRGQVYVAAPDCPLHGGKGVHVLPVYGRSELEKLFPILAAMEKP